MVQRQTNVPKLMSWNFIILCETWACLVEHIADLQAGIKERNTQQSELLLVILVCNGM